MKKLITNIWNWIKSIFSSKSDSDLTEEQKVIAKRFSKETFDHIKDKGVFDENDTNERKTERQNDLAESARKTNEFNDSQAKGITDEGIQSEMDNQKIKDATKLKSAEMSLDKQQDKVESSKLLKEQKRKEAETYNVFDPIAELIKKNNETDK